MASASSKTKPKPQPLPPVLRTCMPLGPDGVRRRPRCLDLFCGAGGMSMGIYNAGFDVVGVDMNPQPFYPFTFMQKSALDITVEFMQQFDYVHASPPCQALTGLIPAHLREKYGDKWGHENLIPPMREKLLLSGVPYTIENVQGARPELWHGVSLQGGVAQEVGGKAYVSPRDVHIRTITLCGTMFGTASNPVLRVFRHRLFESNLPLVVTMRCDHANRSLGAHSKDAYRRLPGLAKAPRSPAAPKVARVRAPVLGDGMVAPEEVDWALFDKEVKVRSGEHNSTGHKDVYHVHRDSGRRFRSAVEVRKWLWQQRGAAATAEQEPQPQSESEQAEEEEPQSDSESEQVEEDDEQALGAVDEEEDEQVEDEAMADGEVNGEVEAATALLPAALAVSLPPQVEMFAVYGQTGSRGSLTQWQQAMGMPWVHAPKPIAQAIPPPFSEYIARQVLEHIGYTCDYPPISYQ